jgi:FMN-dependent NADH-azoreductase
MAMKLLHIDASILGEHSASRRISAAVVERLVKASPGLDVTYRDLGAAPLGHLSGAHLAAAAGVTPEAPTVQDDFAAGQSALADFLAADIVVVGAPMYNFSVPSQLKAWIDRILVAGQTFRYGPGGPEGLAGAKRVIVALSRGNFYGPGAPAEAFEHVETYLRVVFGFIGVTKLEFIIAEGVQVAPEDREKAMTNALKTAGELQAA